jgi:hypothetical protein
MAAVGSSRLTSEHERFTKLRLYQEVGVAVYWVIDADADAGTAEIWTPLDQFAALGECAPGVDGARGVATVRARARGVAEADLTLTSTALPPPPRR